MEILKRRVKCERTLTLVHKALKVGYIDPDTKQLVRSKIGTPQGSVLSPLLANIVLHELDEYLANELMPKYNRGKRRRTNPEYNAVA